MRFPRHFLPPAVGLLLFAPLFAATPTDDFARQAVDWRQRLADKIFPCWHDTAVDWEHGGIAYTGAGNAPAPNRDKVWWRQAEWIAALTDTLQHRENPACRTALAKTLQFIERHQQDPAGGIWHDTVTWDGSPKRPAKAHNWKANQHDVRGLVKFIEAFGAAASR